MRTGLTPRAALSANAHNTPPPTVLRVMRAQPCWRVAGSVNGIESIAIRSPRPGARRGASISNRYSIIVTEDARRNACDRALWLQPPSRPAPRDATARRPGSPSTSASMNALISPHGSIRRG
ncbi:hypothetical protein LLG95_05820 [bacterium]|nr:hypothetical protein [bacterium]